MELSAQEIHDLRDALSAANMALDVMRPFIQVEGLQLLTILERQLERATKTLEAKNP